MSAIVVIYANVIIAGKKLFSSVPAKIKAEVKAELENRMNSGEITEEQLNNLLES